MKIKSFFSVVVVMLAASYGSLTLAQSGNELCDDETNGVVPIGRSGVGLFDAPRVMDCAIDDPLCDDETGSFPDRFAEPMESSGMTFAGLSSEVISHCSPGPATPPGEDPAGNGASGKSLGGQHYVEYTLDATGRWTGYRAELKLTPGAVGTFASLDYRSADGELVEVRIATVDDAVGARWIAATVVGMPEWGTALVPVHGMEALLSLRFAPGALGIGVDGHKATLTVPANSRIDIVRVGHLAVDGTALPPVHAVHSPRFLRLAR